MNEIKETFLKITKSVTRTSSELVKSTKLSMALASEEDNLKKIYMEIGKKVHEIYAYGGSLGKFFDDKFKEIVEAENRVKDIQSQLDAAKGLKSCPKCGKSIDRNAEFCPKCGTKVDLSHGVNDGAVSEPQSTLPRTSEIASGQSAAKQTPPLPRICSACHAENEANTKFCLNCGRML
ncbi:MAG: zinc ribbon domain-containing protein [Clostridiales bacterium]|jgi:uncharacterized membrane protein YvbJ|nr:zinc ribbon domain-containing protein [Clostridiales bacterium]